MSRVHIHLSSPKPVHTPSSTKRAGASTSELTRRESFAASPIIQAKASVALSPSPSIQEAARSGMSGPREPLPYLSTIQRAFGRHDVSGVVAHTDGGAQRSALALNAEAFTMGNHVAFASRPTLHTAAHEAAHSIQQRAGLKLASGIGQQGDVYERHADQVADAVVSGRSAEALLDPFARGGAPGETPQPFTAIQRKAFINFKEVALSNLPLPPNMAADRHRMTAQQGNSGNGDRNIRHMVNDAKSRYFVSQQEILDYANEQTQDIGYVDREKTWVRLPKYPLVLGENHNLTILPDLVEATGHRNYQYEGAKQKSAFIHPGVVINPNRHAIESDIPKLAIGLMGVAPKLKQKLEEAKAKIQQASFFKRSNTKKEIKEEIDQEAQNVAAVKSQDQLNQEYSQQMGIWSQQWEANALQSGRAQGHAQHGGTRDPYPPNRGYERDSVEARYTREALEALKSSTLQHNQHPFKRFYRTNSQIIDTSILELRAGTPVELSTMFKSMITGNFDYWAMIELFTGMAEKEFSSFNIPDASKNQLYKSKNQGNKEGDRMEALRDSYMLNSILDWQRSGIRLFGIGEAHRQILKPLIEAQDKKIAVLSWSQFYKDQYRMYPDQG